MAHAGHGHHLADIVGAVAVSQRQVVDLGRRNDGADTGDAKPIQTTETHDILPADLKEAAPWRHTHRTITVRSFCVGSFPLLRGQTGAGDGNRTHVMSLGSSGPAIERRPQCHAL